MILAIPECVQHDQCLARQRQQFDQFGQQQQCQQQQWGLASIWFLGAIKITVLIGKNQKLTKGKSFPRRFPRVISAKKNDCEAVANCPCAICFTAIITVPLNY